VYDTRAGMMLRSCRGVRRDVLGNRAGQARVVHPHGAEEDARARVLEQRGLEACVFESLPRELHHQALLRIELDGLARRNAEERRVEAADVVEEAAEARRHLAGRRELRVVERVDVPAARRHLANRIDAVAQELPVRRRIRGTGEAAREAHDGDRLVVRGAPRLGRHVARAGLSREVTRELHRRRKLPGEGRRQMSSKVSAERHEHGCGGERIDPQTAKSLRRADGVGRNTKLGGEMLLDQLADS
jgi:hypothetical protein